MTESLAARPANRVLPEHQRFDRVAISFHWLSLALVIVQFSSAWLIDVVAKDQGAMLLSFHRSLGIVIWCVTAGRFVWRTRFAYLPPFPDSMPKLQQRLAKLNEYGLYALLLFQPVTGVVDALFLGRPFQLFLWQVPAILPRDRAVADFFFEMHHIDAYALLLLIGVHALAALFHRFILRDQVLERMLPPAAARSARRGKAAAVR
jgi:cytochrome b561